MRTYCLRVLLMVFTLFMVFSICASAQEAATVAPQPEIQFLQSGTALLSIPSLNGNLIAIRMMKPDGDGPFPVLIGVAGGDGSFAFRPGLSEKLHEVGIMTVDFAPQGRGESEGEDNYHGSIHQDDLKALVDFVSTLPFVRKDHIGILTYSYGIVLASGALARHPEMPVAFLIDWEGPSCPGKDLRRGLENDEAWVQETMRFLSGWRDVAPEEFRLHGGLIFDDEYWQERDASRFAAKLPCPYLRVQFDIDHVQGRSKAHMMAIINAVTEKSGQWTRCNDNQPNVIYTEKTLSNARFHSYRDGEFAGFDSAFSESVDAVLFGYAKEMFFSKSYERHYRK